MKAPKNKQFVLQNLDSFIENDKGISVLAKQADFNRETVAGALSTLQDEIEELLDAQWGEREVARIREILEVYHE